MSSISLKGGTFKRLPSSDRIEGSLFRTLMQKSRNVDEGKALPSSMVLVKAESFETLMLSCFLSRIAASTVVELRPGIKGGPYQLYVVLNV